MSRVFSIFRRLDGQYIFGEAHDFYEFAGNDTCGHIKGLLLRIT
jgi:hypothetical protein